MIKKLLPLLALVTLFITACKHEPDKKKLTATGKEFIRKMLDPNIAIDSFYLLKVEKGTELSKANIALTRKGATVNQLLNYLQQGSMALQQGLITDTMQAMQVEMQLQGVYQQAVTFKAEYDSLEKVIKSGKIDSVKRIGSLATFQVCVTEQSGKQCGEVPVLIDDKYKVIEATEQEEKATGKK